MIAKTNEIVTTENYTRPKMTGRSLYVNEIKIDTIQDLLYRDSRISKRSVRLIAMWHFI